MKSNLIPVFLCSLSVAFAPDNASSAGASPLQEAQTQDMPVIQATQAFVSTLKLLAAKCNNGDEINNDDFQKVSECVDDLAKARSSQSMTSFQEAAVLEKTAIAVRNVYEQMQDADRRQLLSSTRINQFGPPWRAMCQAIDAIAIPDIDDCIRFFSTTETTSISQRIQDFANNDPYNRAYASIKQVMQQTEPNEDETVQWFCEKFKEIRNCIQTQDVETLAMHALEMFSAQYTNDVQLWAILSCCKREIATIATDQRSPIINALLINPDMHTTGDRVFANIYNACKNLYETFANHEQAYLPNGGKSTLFNQLNAFLTREENGIIGTTIAENADVQDFLIKMLKFEHSQYYGPYVYCYTHNDIDHFLVKHGTYVKLRSGLVNPQRDSSDLHLQPINNSDVTGDSNSATTFTILTLDQLLRNEQFTYREEMLRSFAKYAPNGFEQLFTDYCASDHTSLIQNIIRDSKVRCLMKISEFCCAQGS